MPIACDPNQTFNIVLKSDLQKPIELHPRFIFRYLTGREWKECDHIVDQAESIKTCAERFDMVISGIRMGLVGWENLMDRDGNAIPYGPANIDLAITISEAWELLFGLLGNTSLAIDDKKKLDLPSDLPTEKPAADAKA